MPPKFHEEKEIPSFWKERTVGTVETLTWEGDQTTDEDGVSGQPKALNVIGANKERDKWEEGNYISFGRGTASAFEKVQVSSPICYFTVGNYTNTRFRP